MTHTPGPWVVGCERNREGAFNTVDAPAQDYPRGEIALLPCRNPDTPDNQHLIAAAPDLLAACDAAADLIDEHANMFNDPSVAGAVWRKLGEAIGKCKPNG